jgi:hypothetical protein
MKLCRLRQQWRTCLERDERSYKHDEARLDNR